MNFLLVSQLDHDLKKCKESEHPKKVALINTLPQQTALLATHKNVMLDCSHKQQIFMEELFRKSANYIHAQLLPEKKT